MKCKVPRAGQIPVLLFCLVLLGVSGCATRAERPPGSRPFSFPEDAFAFKNDLVWEYYYDARGQWKNRRRIPPPDYSHHCFVVARSAHQFFVHARFDPALPPVGDGQYRSLIRQVVARNPRRSSSPAQRIVIPGFSNLRDFSAAKAPLLKAECGSAWQSYFQRGHWRMMAPISHRHQHDMAKQLLLEIQANRPPVVHIVSFPNLAINHALVLFGAVEDSQSIRFEVYDPNAPEKPARLTFDRANNAFQFPANDYFKGGKVKIYQVYHRWNY